MSSAQALNRKPLLSPLFSTKNPAAKHAHSSSFSGTCDRKHGHDPYETPTTVKARQEALNKLCGIVSPSPSMSASRAGTQHHYHHLLQPSKPGLRKCASSHNMRRTAQPNDDDNVPLALVMNVSAGAARRDRSAYTHTSVSDDMDDDDNIPIALAWRCQKTTTAAC